MTEKILEVRALKKIYHGRTVLDIPHFVFEKGKNYCLIGANGSGKSTLLRILAGSLQSSEGTVTKYFPEPIAYLPQQPYVFSFSVRRNLEMAFSSRTPAAQKKTKTDELLQDVGIASLASSHGNRLSGGEAQRLSVARLLVEPHPLLLLDEPSSATDIAGNELIEAALKKYCDSCSSQLIFSSHALSQAQRMCDELLFFADGVIVEHGPVQELLKAPQSPELKSFLHFWQG